MNVKEQIEKDFIEAYKNREELKISVLRLLKSALKNEEIKSKGQLSENDVIATLKREAKQRKDSIEEYQKADRAEAVEREEDELSIIESYLPKQFNESETKKIVEEIANELNITEQSQIGKLIGAVMSKYGNSIDGSLVSKSAREILK